MENKQRQNYFPYTKESTTIQLENGASKSKTVGSKYSENLVKYIRTYTEKTGIHGLRYTIQTGRPTFERIIWIIIFCTSLYGCIVLIGKTWKKWDTSPVLVSFSKNPTYVYEIPFPAVTICPQTKAKQRQFNFTDAYYKWRDGKLDDEGKKNLSASALICDNHLYTEGNETIDVDAIDHIKNVAPDLSDLMLQCVWTLHYINCSQLFTEILTEDGICFTSNMLSTKVLLQNNVNFDDSPEDFKINSRWTLADGYPKATESDTYPKRVTSVGFTGSLVLLLTSYTQDMDYLCRNQPQGYKLILHNPEELPRVNMRYYQAPLNEELLITVTPEMMVTSERLTNYPPNKRECFFANERDLTFFQRYTQQNCEFECLANFTFSKCHCVALYMPRNQSTPICGPRSSQCLLDAKSELIQQEVERGITSLHSSGSQFSSEGCNCLPACNSLSYNSEISQNEFNWKKIGIIYRENIEEILPGVQMSRITIFFKHPELITSERNELFGTADFLANCGGILGLFTGFSFLSLVEIIYFLSLRLFSNIKMYGIRHWPGQPSSD